MLIERIAGRKRLAERRSEDMTVELQILLGGG